MSIIEKAVNALGKGGDGDKPAQGAESGADSGLRDGTTVQRAGKDMPVELPAQDRGVQAAQPEQQDGFSAAADSSAHAAISTSRPGLSEDTLEITRDRYVKLQFEQLRSLGVLTPNVPRSAIAEEFRTIKRPLLTNIAGDEISPPLKNGNLIMVTSALEGDGKTFTSLSLAISIAMEQDKSVLFIDADTAKAEAGRILGIPSDCPGLIDTLEDESIHPDDLVLRTNIDKLRILPAGDLHTHANELLASDRMRRLMIELSETDPGRVIVFDSPPLLLTTEASVLASFMGQIVFVVSADMTPHHAVSQAIEHIGEDKMVGLVLNRARRRSNPYYYSYGEVYGYGRNRQSSAESG
ncbi:MAG: XrtA-associated tyrosine autokinase [Halioglobus sp.]